MIVKESATQAEFDEFVKSVNWMKDNDPRIKETQLADLLGLSSGYFNRLFRGKTPLTKELYNKWFDEIERPLRIRIQSYIPLNDDELKKYIKEFLPGERDYICSQLGISSDTLTRLLQAGRRRNLLNIYDVLSGKDKLVKAKENTSEIKSQEEDLITKVSNILDTLSRLHISIYEVSNYILGDSSIYSRIKANPNIHLQQVTYQLVYENLSKLRDFNNQVKSLAANDIKDKITFDKLIILTSKTPNQLIEITTTKLNNPKYLINNQTGELVNTLSRGKALLIVSIIRLEENQ